MKLIELLHKELIENKCNINFSVGWAAQDGDGLIEFYTNKPHYHSAHGGYWTTSANSGGFNHICSTLIATDFDSKVVTAGEFAEYVKEMENKNKDWHNTCNIPPVGTKCWICWEDGSERKAEITAIGKEKFMALVDAWGSEVAMTKQGLKFKEIRSEQDIAIEELEKHIADNASLTNYGLALELYKLGYRKQ